MKPYAQNHLQLLAQLGREGYSDPEIFRVCDAHRLATYLFTGLFRPSGKEFMAHVIGTASILGSLQAPAKAVAAGLIYGAYDHGDFGSGLKGISGSKRNVVRSAVGDEVEEYVARCAAMPWGKKTVSRIYERIDRLDSMDRYAVLLRLASKLEDLCDLGPLYCHSANDKRRVYLQQGPAMMDIAEKLGFPMLGQELARVLGETASSNVSPKLRSRHMGILLVPPASYCRRTRVLLCQEASRMGDHLHSINRVRAGFQKIYHRLRESR